MIMLPPFWISGLRRHRCLGTAVEAKVFITVWTSGFEYRRSRTASMTEQTPTHFEGMNEPEAREFAERWLSAWSGDRPELLTSFYTDDAVYSTR
jgi:hypothetical protein